MVSRLWVGRILVLLFEQEIWFIIKDPTRDFCLDYIFRNLCSHPFGGGARFTCLWRSKEFRYFGSS